MGLDDAPPVVDRCRVHDGVGDGGGQLGLTGGWDHPVLLGEDHRGGHVDLADPGVGRKGPDGLTGLEHHAGIARLELAAGPVRQARAAPDHPARGPTPGGLGDDPGRSGHGPEGGEPTDRGRVAPEVPGRGAQDEAVDAIASLDLAIDIIAVLPSTENMPSGTALKPGDIITQLNGKTVEVTNTDAEGRLILADAMVHCAREGADRIVDLATLTGAVLIGLGSTYAGLISNDDELADEIVAVGKRTGELVWRLPLHDEYKDLTKGTITDLVNASAQRKAGTIYAGSFLEEFTEGKPWAHLDIAGTAWDTGREYWGKGPTGFGVHLLIGLARDLCA